MYNENTNFSIRNVIIQFLFVALFVFLLVWLFPLKSDLKDLNTGSEVSVLTERIFYENIIAMKESAKSYYTTPRLPQKIGDKAKMTLGEMLDKKIILQFTDKNGDSCSLTESYVEITKYDEEYIMKVNLKCGDEENYLLVYMGCYDYCTTDICEKNKSDVSAPVIYPSNPTPEPTPTPVVKEYLYEYLKTIDPYCNYSAWSDWSTTKVVANQNKEVETKTETVKQLVGYNVVTKEDKTKPIYGEKEVETGLYETKKVCTKYEYVATGEYTYTDWEYQGDVYVDYSPKETDTEKYIWVDDSNDYCIGDCSSGTTHKYQKWTRTKKAITEYKCTKYEEKKVPVTVKVKYIKGYEKQEIKTPIYENVTVTYYRYRTKTCYSATRDLKWSAYNDTSLLNAGYKYTGNKKEK